MNDPEDKEHLAIVTLALSYRIRIASVLILPHKWQNAQPNRISIQCKFQKREDEREREREWRTLDIITMGFVYETEQTIQSQTIHPRSHQYFQPLIHLCTFFALYKV